MLADSDLFGYPVAAPQTAGATLARRRVVSEEAKRAKLLRHIERSNNLLLFEDVLDYLKAPLLQIPIPAEYASDIGTVAVGVEEDDEGDWGTKIDITEIPYQAWGKPMVTDRNAHHWSRDSLLFSQVRLFWRSFEELANHNNELEKWSTLKWIFRPAIWKYYVYDTRIGASHCYCVHERDEPYGFHNCCIAAGMDEDLVREGVRRNVCADVIEAVERVCSFA